MFSHSRYVGPPALFRVLWGGLLLRREIYTEVKDHGESTRLCIAVAILGGAAFGVRLAAYSGLSAALLAVDRILIVLGQVLFETVIVWAIGKGLVRRELRYGEVLRPAALARAPQVLYALLALFDAPAEANFAVSIWLLVAFAVAIRTALESGWLLAWAIVVGLGVIGELLSRTGTLLPS
jgi:hypothetical protein